MTSASAPPMRAVRPWGQENMTESAATCFSATPESSPSTAGTHIQRNAHFIAAATTAATAQRAKFHSLERSSPNTTASTALPQAMTGVTAGIAGPMPISVASTDESMPIATPDQMPVVAVNTKSTQFTSEPVTSCVTENGPAMTAPRG